MLDKIFVVTTVCDTTTKHFFILYHMPLNLDERVVMIGQHVCDMLIISLLFYRSQ